MTDRIIEVRHGDRVEVEFIDRSKPRIRGSLRRTTVNDETRVVFTWPPEPEPEPTGTVWISRAELDSLPKNAAYDRIKRIADGSQPSLTFSDYSEDHSRWVMANALVGQADRAIAGLTKAVSTSYGQASFKEVTRNLPEYIISAAILDYREQRFLDWLRRLFAYTFGDSDPGTIAFRNENDPGNSGACAGASITSAGLYLEDQSLIDSAIKGIRMFCGETPGQFIIRSGRDIWYAAYPDTSKYTPINPPGSKREGYDVSGFIPVEMERNNPSFRWPPSFTTYVRLDLGSRVIQAELLRKAGVFDAFGLGDNALLRACQAEIRLGWDGPTYFHRRILERRHNVDLGSTNPVSGRCATGLDWTHP